MDGVRRLTRALYLDMRRLVLLLSLGDELGASRDRVVLGHDEELLRLLLELLGKLLDRAVGDDVRQAVMDAHRFAALRDALRAEVAQISHDRPVVKVVVHVIGLPRPVDHNLDAGLADRVVMLFLAGDLAGSAVRAELVVNKESVLGHVYTSFPNLSQMRFMSVS